MSRYLGDSHPGSSRLTSKLAGGAFAAFMLLGTCTAGPTEHAYAASVRAQDWDYSISYSSVPRSDRAEILNYGSNKTTFWVTDDADAVGATVDKNPWLYGQEKFKDNRGEADFYLWVSEKAWGLQTFDSSSANFEMKTTGSQFSHKYTPYGVSPPDKDSQDFNFNTLGTNEINDGWIKFELPLKTQTYYLLWSAGSHYGFPMVRIKVKIRRVDQ